MPHHKLLLQSEEIMRFVTQVAVSAGMDFICKYITNSVFWISYTVHDHVLGVA